MINIPNVNSWPNYCLCARRFCSISQLIVLILQPGTLMFCSHSCLTLGLLTTERHSQQERRIFDFDVVRLLIRFYGEFSLSIDLWASLIIPTLSPSADKQRFSWNMILKIHPLSLCEKRRDVLFFFGVNIFFLNQQYCHSGNAADLWLFSSGYFEWLC